MSRVIVETKRCITCESVKPVSQFNRKSATRLQPYCRDCSRAYSRGHYLANKAKYRARITGRKEQIRQWFRSRKEHLKCAVCSENHPACLHFHHNDPNAKEIHLSKAVACGCAIARIEREMAKCTVLCANCHLKLHWDDE